MQVLELGRAVAEHFDGLGVQPLRHLGVTVGQVEGPAEGARRGLVAGQQQRDQFVAHPLPADPLVGLLPGGDDQPGQRVVPLDPLAVTGDPLRHQPVDHALQGLPGLAEAELLGERHPAGHHAHGDHVEHRLVLDGLEVVPDGLEGAEVDVEQRAAEHAERERRHLPDHVDRAAALVRPQPADQLGRLLRDDARLLGDPLVLEDRLDLPALLAPELALAGQQAVAERPSGLGQADALVVVGGVVRQHVLGVVGVVEEVERLGAHGDPDRVPVLRRGGAHQFEPVPHQPAQQDGGGPARRARRHPAGRGHG